jgi:hypothetical protein
MLVIVAPDWMASKDREKIFQILARLPDRDLEEHIERGRERAFELLEPNEAMLMVVADTLEHNGTLDGDAFLKIADAYGSATFELTPDSYAPR